MVPWTEATSFTDFINVTTVSPDHEPGFPVVGVTLGVLAFVAVVIISVIIYYKGNEKVAFCWFVFILCLLVIPMLILIVRYRVVERRKKKTEEERIAKELTNEDVTDGERKKGFDSELRETFYHYTTRENFEEIRSSGIIKKSSDICSLGEGVYFTTLGPWLSSEELLENNYGE